MTLILNSANVNGALCDALYMMDEDGVLETSRNGDVLVYPTPVITTYRSPMERVLFSPLRNANPFFHLMESLWMLNGQNDLEWPLFFNSGFRDFSDDGVTLHGAYGNRWKNWFLLESTPVWFDNDQIKVILEMLRNDPMTRRAVLTMWDPRSDLGKDGKDLPCNTHIYFDIGQEDNRLNMTVCCRSNDLWWGVYGANVVHFSMLLEYMAGMIGVGVGDYRQFSNNFHLYTDIVNRNELAMFSKDANENDLYLLDGVSPMGLFTDGVHPHLWQNDLISFMRNPRGDHNYHHNFFPHVAVPMYNAWYNRKAKNGTGLFEAEQIMAEDWRIACVNWIKRAELKKENKV